MENYRELTIEDHFASMGYKDGWALALMISQFTVADPEIASGRAVDKVSHPRFGKAVSFFSKGFLIFSQEVDGDTDMSPNKCETIRQLIKGVVAKTKVLFQNE